MTGLARPLAAVLVSALLLVAIAALSQVPYGVERSGDAMLRLSWRIRGERVEECRRLTQAELEALPLHMRREEVCEGRIAPYRLTIELDGRTLEDALVSAAGARNDRPIYVFREIRLPPGAYAATIRFVRDGEDAACTGEEAPEGRSPACLELSSPIRLGQGEIALVTYEEESRRLVLRDPGTEPAAAGAARE
jgi:hypothetical protein